MGNELDIFKGVANRPVFTKEDVTAISVGVQAQYAPRISLKGCVFNIVNGQDRTTIGNGKEIKCIILGTSGSTIKDPSDDSTKSYDSRRMYAEEYSGADGIAPSCASINGITPDSTVVCPKGETCDLCPMSVWGSKAGRNGAKSRACGAYRRLALCTITASKVQGDEDVYAVYQIDVPVMSLSNLRSYVTKVTDTYGLPLDSILTAISIDSPDGFTQLHFKEHLSLNAAQYETIKKMRVSDEVKTITTGELNVAAIENEKDNTDKAETPAPQPEQMEMKLDNSKELKDKISAALDGV